MVPQMQSRYDSEHEWPLQQADANIYGQRRNLF